MIIGLGEFYALAAAFAWSIAVILFRQSGQQLGPFALNLFKNLLLFTLLVQALNARGIRAVMVGTGQTTLIQGGRYGAALDALVPQFISGEVEHQVVAILTLNHDLLEPAQMI